MTNFAKQYIVYLYTAHNVEEFKNNIIYVIFYTTLNITVVIIRSILPENRHYFLKSDKMYFTIQQYHILLNASKRNIHG